MSTDRVSAALRRFRRTLWGLLAALTLVCLGLVAVNLLNGPRLTGFEVDTAGVVAEANQRLVLETNQQLADITADQVTITPATPLTVQASSDSIVIAFPQPLAYETHYRVSVSGVTGAGTSPASDLEVSWRTEEPPLRYLSRSAVDPATPDVKDPDRIVEATIGSAETSVVYSAPYIQQFVPIGAELAVVTVNADLSNTLTRVGRDGRGSALTLPGVGTVEDLQAAENQSLLGFRFTSAVGAPGPSYENALFLLDLATGVADPVLGLGDAPVQATGWGFMPGRADLVARQYDTTLLLIDPLADPDDGAEPIPLGQFSGLGAFAPDGVRIMVSDQDAQYVLDLSQGTEAAITPQTVAGTTRYTAELRFLAGGGGYVQRLAELDAKTGVARQYLTLVTDGVSRDIYIPASATESVTGFALSPNDQYVAVQIVPNVDTAVSDGYPVGPQATDATTAFIDIETGRLVRSVVGIGAVWP